jgi:hypothetical protein
MAAKISAMTTETLSRNDLSQTGLPTNMTLFSYLTGASGDMIACRDIPWSPA